MNTQIESFGKEGLVSIEYPAYLSQSVEKAVGAWKKVCGLPEDVRMQFPYNSGEGMGVGYELKKTPGSTLDLKEDFHLTQGSLDWLRAEAARINNLVITDFIEKASDLLGLMDESVVKFAKEVERAYSLDGFAGEIKSGSDQWFLRFLHYFGGAKVGKEIAKAHADKSGFTSHFYESDSGLEYLDRNYQWRKMLVSRGKMVVIPGMRGQYYSKGKLKATFHRVVANPEVAIKGRFSAVAFIHPSARVSQYNKQGRGRLQEFKPGFNYEMSPEEFGKLFKPSPLTK